MASIWLFAAIYLFTSIGANIDEMAFKSIQGACASISYLIYMVQVCISF
jgi:hypothetical protein